jgi:hypothetical protein
MSEMSSAGAHPRRSPMRGFMRAPSAALPKIASFNPGLAAGFLFAFGLIAATGLALLVSGSPEIVGAMLRDPANGSVYYTGALSTLGVMFWSGTAGVALFAAAIARPSVERRFLMAAGLFTLYLALDDGVLLHEGWLRYGLGLSQTPIFAAIAAAATLIIWSGRALFGGFAVRMALLIGLVSGALSVAIDFSPYQHAFTIVEDVTKIVALSMWCAVVLNVAWTTAAMRATSSPHRAG